MSDAAVIDAITRATQPQRADHDPLAAAIRAKRDQADGAILQGRMSPDLYQYQAGYRAGLSEALRIIEAGGKR